MKVELTIAQASGLRGMLKQALNTYPTGGGSISGVLSNDGMSLAWEFTRDLTEDSSASSAFRDWKERRKLQETEKNITLEILEIGDS